MRTHPDVDAWDAWHPRLLADRLERLRAPWSVAAGWALDLFRGRQSRDHGDLEIAIPRRSFADLPPLFPELEFWVPQGEDSLARMTPQTLRGDAHQTWAWDPGSGCWRFDVFREPHDGDVWICRRDASIRLPYERVVARSVDGIPFQQPEIVLLFKAKHTREKDVADFEATLPLLAPAQRAWLDDALAAVHPDHQWRRSLS